MAKQMQLHPKSPTISGLKFFDFPYEIRSMIYHLALTDINTCGSNEEPCICEAQPAQTKFTTYFSLLLTSRIVKNEIEPIFQDILPRICFHFDNLETLYNFKQIAKMRDILKNVHFSLRYEAALFYREPFKISYRRLGFDLFDPKLARFINPMMVTRLLDKNEMRSGPGANIIRNGRVHTSPWLLEDLFFGAEHESFAHSESCTVLCVTSTDGSWRLRFPPCVSEDENHLVEMSGRLENVSWDWTLSLFPTGPT